IRDGWYHTEDIGYADEQGYVYIKERKRDLIISGGENIYPAELEVILSELPGVSEAAVIGQPDPRWGETPLAVIVAEAGVELQQEHILAAFRDRLARFKHPRAVVFVDALPRNSIGKVQKFRLRQLLLTNDQTN
ncbi:MAG: long-chain fatty acid--CoA ligase, partial [Candidatus Competibacteraceae bacterium]|nr:long-chain fatty acid--CoA ligase [Candidatus Competibacteraceae bacterium]